MALVGGYGGPYIDETVEHVGVSRLRSLNTSNLRDFDRTLVIQDNDKPLAVLLSYDQFLDMQRQLMSLIQTVEVLKNEKELTSVADGLDAASKGQTRLLSEIDAELKKKEKGG